MGTQAEACATKEGRAARIIPYPLRGRPICAACFSPIQERESRRAPTDTGRTSYFQRLEPERKGGKQAA